MILGTYMDKLTKEFLIFIACFFGGFAFIGAFGITIAILGGL